MGPRIEIDVAVHDRGEQGVSSSNNGGVKTLTRTWTAPPVICSVPVVFPDSFEVLIYSGSAGWDLVGAIEFVSPGNKDREEERRAFLAKCSSYLHEGVSVVILDIVTTRHATHITTSSSLARQVASPFPDDVHLYAAAYSPVSREDHSEIDIWAERCSLGSPLPTMPLRLARDLCVPVEFELTYQEICRRRRVI